MSTRVWVITGANSGIGLTIAKYALQQGDKVVATIRTMAKFSEELKAAGASPLLVDLNDSDKAVRDAAVKAIQIYGHVDVLVNNAGIFSEGVGPIEEIPMDDVRRTFQSNVFGAIAFTQPFVEHFRLRKTGQVINMSSVGAYTRTASTGVYSASKAALEVFSDALQHELTPYGIRVLTVILGAFQTNIFAPRPLSTVYTDHATQGYDIIRRVVPEAASVGMLGDLGKLATRVYEIVTGTGHAQGISIGEGDKREWNKIPLCCHSAVLSCAQSTVDNIRAFEELCSSLELDSAKDFIDTDSN